MSQPDTVAGEMVQLTFYEDPNSWIQSQHGTIKWKNYLLLEKERIEKSPGRVVEIRHGTTSAGDKYALFVNNVGAIITNGNYVRE